MNEEIRDLFIEELEEVRGGAPEGGPVPSFDTTQACCEELIFDRCCL